MDKFNSNNVANNEELIKKEIDKADMSQVSGGTDGCTFNYDFHNADNLPTHEARSIVATAKIPVK